MLTEVIERVSRMEQYFDALQKVQRVNPDAFRENDTVKAVLRLLMQYYDGGQWLQDYELDEKRLLPQTLKRGVLSQDALNDFFDSLKPQNNTY